MPIPESIDVYLFAGQSNMSGTTPPGAADALAGALRLPHGSALIYFAALNLPGEERLERPHVRKWTPLSLGCGLHPDSFGPELAFGHTMAARTVGRSVAIIKSERGGSSLLTGWRPFDLEDPTAFANRMFRDAAEAIENLTQEGHDARLAGFVWYQGEAETRASNDQPDAYTPAFKGMCLRIAHELNQGQDFDKVIFRVHPHDTKPSPHYESIRSQLVALAEQDPRAAWVDVDDLTYHDRLHLDAASLLTAGDRAAEAMLKLKVKQSSSLSQD